MTTRCVWRRYRFSAHTWLSQIQRRRFLFAVWSGLALAGSGCVGIVFARPFLGSAVLLLVPLLVRASYAIQEDWSGSRLQESALAFFTLLRVLVSEGDPLPQALFHVAHRLRSPFAQHLSQSLAAFERGRSLSQCLERFQSRYPKGTAVYWVVLLERAYRQGLPVLSLLKSACVLLEAENLGQQKARRARRWAMGQAGTAALLPWLLLAVYGVFQPVLLDSFWNTQAGPVCLAVAFVTQLAGGWVLWKLARFY
ncbi:MAG: type II secretion system F family protein [Bdellovibrionota bacterium]